MLLPHVPFNVGPDAVIAAGTLASLARAETSRRDAFGHPPSIPRNHGEGHFRVPAFEGARLSASRPQSKAHFLLVALASRSTHGPPTEVFPRPCLLRELHSARAIRDASDPVEC